MIKREAFIHEKINEEFARWIRGVSLAGSIIFLAFTAIDRIVYPSLASRFFVYRVAAAFCLILTAYLVGRTRAHSVHRLLGLFAVCAPAVAIEAMILQTGGYASDYAAGMVFFAVIIFAYIPGSMLFQGLAACSIIGIYALPILAAEPFGDLRALFPSTFFLSSIILSLIALRYTSLRNFREQASALYEVRMDVDVLPRSAANAAVDPVAAVRRLREEIAARRSTERMRDSSESKYRALFEYAPDGIYLSDLTGNFLDGNRKAEEMTGYGREELIGSNYLKKHLIPPAFMPKAVKLLALNALGQATGPDEFELVTKGGGRMPVEISTLPMTIDGKRVVLGIARDITERKRMEDELRESESLFRSISETSIDIIFRVDRKGRVIYVSPSVESQLGYAMRDVMGLNFLQFVHEENRSTVQESFARILDGETLKAGDLRLRKKSGDFIYSEINVSPILDENKDIKEIQGVIHNITERRNAEHEIRRINQGLEWAVAERTVQLEEANRALRLEVVTRRQSEQNLLLVTECLELLPLGVSIVDTAGQIVYVNQADAELHGHAKEVLIGSDVGIYAGSRSLHAKSFEEIFAGGPWKRESINIRKDRKPFPVQLISRAVSDREGKSLGIITACEDITERKRAEEDLREGARKYQELTAQLETVLEAIPDVMLLLTPELQVQWINRPGEIEVRRLSGQKNCCCDVLGACEKKGHTCFAAETLRTGTKQERRYVYPDGRTVEIRTFPIKDKAGGVMHVLVSLADVTGKIRIQEEIERSRRLAALGELAAGVAHEINNPISSIINYGQLIVDDSAPGDVFAEYGGRIIRDGERVAEIVKSMLSFARQRPAERTRCSIRRILDDIRLLAESQLRKEGVELIINLDPGLPDVEANNQQLEQVLINLISNARYALSMKHPDAGKTKMISIRGERLEEAGRGEVVRLRVRDNGTGIPRLLLDMVFQPFFTTKPVGKGTGLGLSVCHGIIEAHGGTLKIESEEGQYAEMIIDLPAGRFASDGSTT